MSSQSGHFLLLSSPLSSFPCLFFLSLSLFFSPHLCLLTGPNPSPQEATGSRGRLAVIKDPSLLLPLPSGSLTRRQPRLQGVWTLGEGQCRARLRLKRSFRSSQVLFTGVVDEAGERALAPLGGSMARGVADMNCLVTDKVRRTVKFLCAVAKGIPVVTTQWLEKVSSKTHVRLRDATPG